jgi:hypothetical protein
VRHAGTGEDEGDDHLASREPSVAVDLARPEAVAVPRREKDIGRPRGVEELRELNDEIGILGPRRRLQPLRRRAGGSGKERACEGVGRVTERVRALPDPEAEKGLVALPLFPRDVGDTRRAVNHDLSGRSAAGHDEGDLGAQERAAANSERRARNRGRGAGLPGRFLRRFGFFGLFRPSVKARNVLREAGGGGARS